MNLLYFALMLAVVNVAAFASSEAQSATLDQVRAGVYPEKTRLVFDISDGVEYQVKPFNQPSLVAVIMANMTLQAPLSQVALANTPIQHIDAAAAEDGQLKVEVYLDGEFRYRTFMLPPDMQRGYRIVVDLYPEGTSESGTVDSVTALQETAGSNGEAKQADVHKAPASTSSTPREPAATNGSGVSMDFSGTWEQEWAVETDGGDSQKFEALIEPRLDIGLAPNMSLTAIARIRLDTVGDLGPGEDKPDNYSSINGPFYNNSHTEFSLRELYLDTRWSGTYWRIGKQQVVWGEADGIKVLDVVNPQSYREFILEDFDKSRIPLTMVNMQAPLGEDYTLQLLWIPDTTYHELAESGTPYYLTSPLLVPVAPEDVAVDIENLDVPDNLISDSDFGGRLSGFVSGWDVTLNYLYHYQDYPVLYQSVKTNSNGATAVVSPEYERNHLMGGTLSNAFGDFTFRAEVAYSTDTFHVSSDLANGGIEKSPELGSVFGLDWQLAEYDTMMSVQWFQSHLFDYESSVSRSENEQNVSVYFQRDFASETWQLDAMALYSIDNQDSLLQLKLKHLWRGNIEVWLGADIFSGDRDGIYGQFRDFDRVLVGFEVGF